MKQEFTSYSVGDKILQKMEKEGAVFEVHDDMCWCYISLTEPTQQEKDSVEKGDVVVDLADMNGVLFVCVSIGDTLTFEMPFSMRLYSEFRLKYPQEGRYFMPIFLIDHETNTIAAMRILGFDQRFSKKLYEISRMQWENPLGEYDIILQQIFSRLPAGKIKEESCARMVFGKKVYSWLKEDDYDTI